MNSFFPFLAAPSAIFTGTETAALRICDVNPNLSETGNELVNRYSSLTNSQPSNHAFNFLCGFITNHFGVDTEIYKFQISSQNLRNSKPNIHSSQLTAHSSHFTSHP